VPRRGRNGRTCPVRRAHRKRAHHPRRDSGFAGFFSQSLGTLLRIFPPAILGVILFLTGAQLALGACDISKDKGERLATVVTAALAIWNVGIAFVVGSAIYLVARRGWRKL
jgi:xanthine/uracil permease